MAVDIVVFWTVLLFIDKYVYWFSGTYAGDGGLPADCDTCWWKYLYASMVLFVCLLVCLVGGGMFAKTLTVILAVSM